MSKNSRPIDLEKVVYRLVNNPKSDLRVRKNSKDCNSCSIQEIGKTNTFYLE